MVSLFLLLSCGLRGSKLFTLGPGCSTQPRSTAGSRPSSLDSPTLYTNTTYFYPLFFGPAGFPQGNILPARHEKDYTILDFGRFLGIHNTNPNGINCARLASLRLCDTDRALLLLHFRQRRSLVSLFIINDTGNTFLIITFSHGRASTFWQLAKNHFFHHGHGLRSHSRKQKEQQHIERSV